MAEALSPEAARAEVTSYTGQSLTVDQIKSLRKVLAMPRDDSAIHSHLRKHGHPLGALPSETRWWLKVHKAMTGAGIHHDQPPGTHSKPADNQRKAVLAWLELRILPALEGDPPASATPIDTVGAAAPATDGKPYSPPPETSHEIPKSKVWESDPEKQDRGTKAHKNIQNALRDALQKVGLDPRSPKVESGDPPFDIAWKHGNIAFVGEVKSLTADNEDRQIRLAIGQVLDYVYSLQWNVHAVRGVVAIERKPKKIDHWMALCEDHGITLTWPEAYDDLLTSLLADTD